MRPEGQIPHAVGIVGDLTVRCLARSHGRRCTVDTGEIKGCARRLRTEDTGEIKDQIIFIYKVVGWLGLW